MSVSSPRAFLARGGERRRLRTKVPRRSLGPRVALTHGPGRRVAAFDLRALGVRGGRTIHGRCSSGDAFYRSCARALSTDHFLAVNFSSALFCPWLSVRDGREAAPKGQALSNSVIQLVKAMVMFSLISSPPVSLS